MNFKQWNMPLYQAIRKYSVSGATIFHMPGHKLGKGFPEDFKYNLASLDLTEIDCTDNLHCPEGVIMQAQELAATAFGSDRAFFLVNGSTCGIHAAILSVCKPGQWLITGRDCHKSVTGGLVLSGALPWYIKPETCNSFGITTVITPEAVEDALAKCPDAAAVLITRPNYYGICSDLKNIADIVHKHNKILIVDEAHGAHLCFHPALPGCAMDLGADICIQSAHKTLPALTQGAYLHVKGERVDADRIAFNLSVIETSSPSYIIMSSLDMARALMENTGKSGINMLLDNIHSFKEHLSYDKYFDILDEKSVGKGRHDATRLVINTAALGKTGFDVGRELGEKYGIKVEMSDYYNIVCITTVADNCGDFNRLEQALEHISQRNTGLPPLAGIADIPSNAPNYDMSPRDATFAQGHTVALHKAEGLTSKEIIVPYPPGIPIVCPGEIILQDVIEYIYNIIKVGGKVLGLHDNMEISVVK